MKARWTFTAFAAAILVLASGASAAEVAFYPFSEGSNGTDAIGVALHNAVDPSSLSGSAVRNDGSTATATFLDDIPGRYLYTNNVWRADAIYSTNVFRSIQTSWFTNSWDAQINSATSIEFADLGAQLAALDSWTVEFFFKFDSLKMTRTGDYATYQYNVRFGEDERVFMLLQSQPDSAGRGYSVRAIYAGNAANSSIARLTNGDGIVPGMWHHMAVTYNGETRKIKAILDYTHSGSERECTGDKATTFEAFSLGNGLTAARFAALRVTDRVLSSKELLRASDIPPDDKALETSFHWTFESNVTGASLGTVPNEALWRVRYDAPVTNQYAYAVDGQIFRHSGDGVVTPYTFTYTDESIGTLTMDGYASNVTDRIRDGLVISAERIRPNTNCAFLVVGPKNASSDYFGKGPSFLMGDVDLLTASDFTAEMYWRPDLAGWRAVLGSDPRTRASVFGVKGAFKNGISGSITTQYAWDLYLDMRALGFTFNVIIGPVDGVYQQKSYAVPGMKTAYQEKCDNEHLQHYAVVYRVADAGNNGNPTVRFFIDHEECETLTLPAPIVDFPACFKDGMAFSVGGNLNDHPMQGWFDEIRYTERALPPSEFLVLQHRPFRGTFIIMR
jgi:hypothetical protein